MEHAVRRLWGSRESDQEQRQRQHRNMNMKQEGPFLGEWGGATLGEVTLR